ncbi:glycerate kinase [Flavisericum labens]|uniref:glycerate kinase n=1 Tax=Flavisericum labens TaxID=3377112 RepID=UPI00387AC91D
MKIILAPDKFKSSLTGLQFCNAAEEGLLSVNPDLEILKLPLADGGDGTLEVVNFYLKGKMVQIEVNNPFFQPVMASYLYAENLKTAYIEMAEASGLKLLNPTQFDCKNATTFGTGEMIGDAIERGAKTIILGIGGSATNDCGIGMATALGYQFLDEDGNKFKPIGSNLSEIVSIKKIKVHPKLFDVDFKIACDVTNALYGENGAARVYALQKGATNEDIEMLDKGLQSFSKVIEAEYNIEVQSIKGAGAAGGMGIASKVFLDGKLIPGIQLIRELVDFDSKITNATWVITGEGKLDGQTFSGKAIQGVLSSAKAKNINVAALCGAIDLNKAELKKMGIDYADTVMCYSKSFDDAMVNSYGYIKKMAAEFAKKML